MIRPTAAELPLLASSASRRETPPSQPGRVLLEEHFDLIQERLLRLSRRSGLPDHEADEFRSWALFKLVEDEYRILAHWQGRSSFSTYLTVVLTNLMRDYRIRVWGKWRSSAVALRRGPEAVLLEKLWLRDGLPLDEVIQHMRTERRVPLSTVELERIAADLPPRVERRQVGEEDLQSIGIDGQVEARVEEGERALAAARLRGALLPAIQALSKEDRLLLKLHYRDGLSMAAISPLLRKPQRELYSWRDRCLKRLRQALERMSLNAEWLGALQGWPLWDAELEGGGLWE
jgi:RNA polymerase sigma factor for flagellar operon FliA